MSVVLGHRDSPPAEHGPWRTDRGWRLEHPSQCIQSGTRAVSPRGRQRPEHPPEVFEADADEAAAGMDCRELAGADALSQEVHAHGVKGCRILERHVLGPQRAAGGHGLLRSLGDGRHRGDCLHQEQADEPAFCGQDPTCRPWTTPTGEELIQPRWVDDLDAGVHAGCTSNLPRGNESFSRTPVAAGEGTLLRLGRSDN